MNVQSANAKKITRWEAIPALKMAIFIIKSQAFILAYK